MYVLFTTWAADVLYWIYKLEPKTRAVYLIQHGRECCKGLLKLFNFVNLLAKWFSKCILYKTRKLKLKFMQIKRNLYHIYKVCQKTDTTEIMSLFVNCSLTRVITHVGVYRDCNSFWKLNYKLFSATVTFGVRVSCVTTNTCWSVVSWAIICYFKFLNQKFIHL